MRTVALMEHEWEQFLARGQVVVLLPHVPGEVLPESGQRAVLSCPARSESYGPAELRVFRTVQIRSTPSGILRQTGLDAAELADPRAMLRGITATLRGAPDGWDGLCRAEHWARPGVEMRTDPGFGWLARWEDRDREIVARLESDGRCGRRTPEYPAGRETRKQGHDAPNPSK